MSHIHLPFGVMPIGWSIIGYIIAVLLIFLFSKKIKKEELSKKIPFIGVISAMMLITMSIPLGFLPFHINLTVLCGIIIGPYLGFIAVFIVNIMLAFLGHGGIDAVGINTLIIGFEAIVGYYLFNALRTKIRPTVAVASTTIITLLASTLLMIGIVVLTNVGWEYALPHKHTEEKTISKDIQTTSISKEDSHENESISQQLSEINIFYLSGWTAIGIIIMLGIALESFITMLIVSFILKVRPDILNNQSV